MLCRAADTVPSGEGWVIEAKWDGWRLLAGHDQNRRVCVWTRHGNSHAGKLPYLEEQLAQALPPGTLLDGEIVALADDGAGGVAQDFDALGPIFAARGPHQPSPESSPLHLVAFDVLELEGEDLRPRPWHERRAVLDEILPRRVDSLCPSTVGPATTAAHQHHLELRFEGSVAKKRDEAYLGGRRRWLKIKAKERARAVVRAVSHGRDGTELRLLCTAAEEIGGRVAAGELLGWAEVWTPHLRGEVRKRGEQLRGAEVTLAYSGISARGRLREARLSALA